ncbi:MAG: glycosyltransferase [Massilia sp.]
MIVGTGNNGTQALREHYPEDNLIIEDFLPFDEVLPHADVCLTNGGYGGVIQSLKNRVPIVAVGIFEGKNEICSRVGYFGYGIDLQSETPCAAAIRQAVQDVLGKPQYGSRAAALAAEFAAVNAEEHNAMLIGQLLGA